MGAPARCLAVAARALLPAAVEEALPELLTWVNTALERLKPKFSWYTVAKVLAAIARLAPNSQEAHAVIRDAAEIAFSVRAQDQSGVIDFERSLRRILSAIGDEALWEALNLNLDLGAPM